MATLATPITFAITLTFIVTWVLGRPVSASVSATRHRALLSEVSTSLGPKFVEVKKPCAEGCTKRGNCNIEEGRCECGYGFGGPTCESMLPACQTGPDAFPFIGSIIPRTCECFRQTIKYDGCDPVYHGCNHPWLPNHNICFEREGKPASEQWSKFPDFGSSDLAWKRISPFRDKLETVAADEARNHFENFQGRLRMLPPEKCQEGCNQQGGCVQESFGNGAWNAARCLCHKGWSGPTCKDVDNSKCYNNCSGRGKCIAGFCHCTPPWFGLDCSRSKAYAPENPAAVLPVQRSNIKIYMYELPANIASAIEHDDFITGHDGIYMAYQDFISAFTTDWGVRTENPWEANLFYIPAMNYEYTGNLGSPAFHARWVIKYVQQNFPFFNRSGGKDHFMLFTGDRGFCYGPPEARDLIKITHFGLSYSPAKGDPLNFRPEDQEHGCLNPVRDVVTAPHADGLNVEAAHQLYDKYIANGFQDPNRKMLFFFAGGVRHGAPDYSGGARQAVHAMLTDMKAKGTLPPDVMAIEGGVHNYIELLLTTKFCMVPYGHGWGIRINFAMLHACIPVVIQDKVVQPYEDVIPYEDFSVRLGVKDVPVLIDTLRSIPEEKQVAMRQEMYKYYRAYIWDQSRGGQAYNYTIKALRRRLNHYWADLYRL